MYSSARHPKRICRKINLWKQADIQGIKDELTNLVDSAIVSDDIDTTWENIKSKITKTIERRSPSKMTTSRYTIPWMNSGIKRTIRRKKRAYRKADLTKKQQDKDHYKELQREVQLNVRRANMGYMETSVSRDYKENSQEVLDIHEEQGPGSHWSRTFQEHGPTHTE